MEVWYRETVLVVEEVVGASEAGVDRGACLLSMVPLVKGTPFTTSGGVLLGVMPKGVEYAEFPLWPTVGIL
jgi:hypothetical protein